MAKVSSSYSHKDCEPKLRFKGFEDKWHTSTLGELGTFTKGAPLSKSDISSDGEPFILYGELYTTYKEITTQIVRKTTKTVDSECLSRIGDVIIPTSGETAEEIATATCVMLPNVILAGDLNIYRNSTVDGRIISYIINHVVNGEILRVAQGKSVVHIKADEIAKIAINYPSTEEQDKLVKFLSLLDIKIEKQRQLVDSLKSYKRGLLSLIFSGKNTTHILDEMLQKGKAGGTPKSSNRSYYQGDIPFLSIADMTEQGKYIYKTEKHISENGLQNSTAWIVPANSLILSMYASYGFVSINKVPLATSQALFNMVVKRSVNVEYIYYYLLYLANTDYYIKMVSTGTQPNLNAEKVKAIPLYLPPLNKQEYIVKLLQSYDNRLTMEEKILTHLQSQKLALLQQLFI